MPVKLVTVNGAPTAENERDDGIALALTNAHPAWKAAVRKFIYDMPCGWIGIGEDITQGCLAAGIPAPTWGAKPQNSWGAMVNAMIRHGELETLTGQRHMRVPKSHARKSQLLRRTNAI